MQDTCVSPPGHDDVAAQFLVEIAVRGPRAFVANAPAFVGGLRIGRHLMPVSVLQPSAAGDPSWVVSLRSAYGPYALEEIRALPFAVLRPILATIVKGVDRALVAIGLDRIVCVNNWLLSTNVYPDWDGRDIPKLTQVLAQTFPAHFIAFRSLNERHHPELLERFRAAGWDLVPSRQVWIAEPGARVTHNRRIDARLLAHTALVRTHADSFGEGDWVRAADLYAQLYLRKYSTLNPIFTPAFLRWAHLCGLMRIEGLRHADGRLMAVVGTIASHAVVTTPLVGYDLSQPRAAGLYRMAMALSFEDMERRGLSFNISAGVGRFKRLRGALPVVEYSAVYCRHLSFGRRLPLRALGAALERIAVPLMRRYDL